LPEVQSGCAAARKDESVNLDVSVMAVKYLCDLCGKELEQNSGWSTVYADNKDGRVRIEVTLVVTKTFKTERSHPLCCFECTKKIVNEGQLWR
jgi:hypothetical protein